jgi:hypothetical protein
MDRAIHRSDLEGVAEVVFFDIPLVAEPPYRGLGHRIRYLIRVAYREQEDVAGDSQKELMGISVRKRCFYLMPVIRTINLFRRRTQGVK